MKRIILSLLTVFILSVSFAQNVSDAMPASYSIPKLEKPVTTKQYVQSFTFDQKEEMKEFIMYSFREAKEAGYLHKKIRISVKDEKTVTITIMTGNQLLPTWNECSNTYWNATPSSAIVAQMQQLGQEALGALCSAGYSCVCYNEYVDSYFTGEGQWWGHSYCVNITVYEATTCPCLNPAC